MKSLIQLILKAARRHDRRETSARSSGSAPRRRRGRSLTVRFDCLEQRLLLTGMLGLDTNANTLSAAHGDAVNYSYAVTFAGAGGGPTEADGASIVVSDDGCAPVAPVLGMGGFNAGDSDQDGRIDDGESWQFACSVTVPPHNNSEADPFVNHAMVTGTDSSGDPAAPGSDSFSLDIGHTEGVLDIDKSANLISVLHGGSVNFTFAVTYTPGSDGSPARNIVVTDVICNVAPAFTGGDANGNGLLDAAETWDYTCSHSVPLLHAAGENDPLETTASVAGQDADGDAVTSAISNTVTVDVLHALGSLNITQSADRATVSHAELITFSFLVTYAPGADGSPVQDVVVLGDHCRARASFLGGDANADGLLDGGENWQFQCTFDIPAAHAAGEEDPIRSSATATARDLDGDGVSEISNMVSVDIRHSSGALTITKNADRTTVVHGGTLTYTFATTYVAGADTSPARNIVVTDPRCDAAPTFTGGDANGNMLLDAGESWTHSCAFAVPAAHAAGENDPIVNMATVAGQDLDGDAVTGDSSNSVSVDLVHGTISGRKFLDVDGNAMRGASEQGLPGVTINLFRDTNGNGSFDDGADTLAATQTSDATGNFRFGEIAPGTYFVREVVQANFVETTPARTAVVTASEDLTGFDFGNQPQGAVLIQDPCDSTKTALVVVGTAGADEISIRPAPAQGSFRVQRNRLQIGTFMPTGTIFVYGLAGHDRIAILASVTRRTIVRGGAGNDTLNGGGGPDALIGDEGADVLNGGRGRDVLIGGAGTDRPIGGADDDILIAGNTGHDADDLALCSILDEWTSNRVYGLRVRNLLDGTGSTDRLNGTIRLNVGTVHDDAASDFVTGGSEVDWFLILPFAAARDRITDRVRREFVVEV